MISLVIFSAIFLIVILLVTGSFGSFVFSALILLLGYVFTFSVRSKRDRAYSILLISFLIYGGLALLHYCDLIFCNHYTESDELTVFIPFVEANVNNGFIQLLENAVFASLGQFHGYLIYVTICAKFGNLFDGYNQMLVFLSTVLIACLYAILMYKLLLLKISENRAYKYTILYVLCSPIILYSFVGLRDIHIAFLFLIGIYIVLSEKKMIKGILMLIIIDILIYTFRIENGHFFILLILYYIYIKLKTYKIIRIVLIVGAFLFGSALMFDILSDAAETLDTYTEYTKSHANADGMAMVILNLPSPIKEFACFILSQIFPIPPWSSFEVKTINGVYSFVIACLTTIKTMFWCYVIFSSVRFLMIKKIRNVFINKYNIILLISFLYIALCSTEYYEVRRLMCVYPIIYACYCDVRCNVLSSKDLRMINREFLLCYGGFLLCFIVLFR